MKFKDYYEILGVPKDASQDEIKRAYRKLARKYHPDVSKEPDAEERFKVINEANEVLKDPEKRAAYDQLGANWQAGQEFNPPPDWDAGFEFSGGGYTEADAAHFSDFFESLFGGGGPFGSRGSRYSYHRQGPLRGEDHHAKILIRLEDAYYGSTRNITLKAPELDSSGHVVVRPRTLKVKIPRGITAGQRIRLAGQGGPGSSGGPNGDLYLEIEFEPHPLFAPDGRDIYLSLPVTPWEAALGAKVQVPTLGGKVDLKIPPGAQSGQKLRLKGRGLPGKPPGDQYVELKIVTPPARDEKSRELYRQMAETMPYNPRQEMEAYRGEA
ncbi:DnaJ C-terminal domain-containing protein [Thiohalobacter sp. IOR34]|uniref:DnaJ C-terminal domain-containing protein n=1 Tax=Thiohalobacter sp. IOR34 TaxID=3057176 RepID=UPI0025AF50EA|nr:DnaJ C-terminal domain-containing protein [Thiohalobacter sp. IOR34]WJW75820.1 DnaJ C-terminal domain-containing protein [Thiohalobacter sp. IOR34]